MLRRCCEVVVKVLAVRYKLLAVLCIQSEGVISCCAATHLLSRTEMYLASNLAFFEYIHLYEAMYF